MNTFIPLLQILSRINGIMIENASKPGVISYRFVERYRQKHGRLPPSVSRTLADDQYYLPTTELFEHLEGVEPPMWSEVWGRKRFMDRGLRVAGEYEEVVAQYVQALAREEKARIEIMPASRRTRAAHGLIITSHTTEWGIPVAKVFWNDGGSIFQINLEFLKEEDPMEF